MVELLGESQNAGNTFNEVKTTEMTKTTTLDTFPFLVAKMLKDPGIKVQGNKDKPVVLLLIVAYTNSFGSTPHCKFVFCKKKIWKCIITLTYNFNNNLQNS